MSLPSSYQQYIHLSRYARFSYENNRRETWEELVTRNKNIMKLLEMSESKDFAKMLDALSVAYDSYKESPRTSGGIGGMLKVMGDPDVQGALKLLGKILPLDPTKVFSPNFLHQSFKSS